MKQRLQNTIYACRCVHCGNSLRAWYPTNICGKCEERGHDPESPDECARCAWEEWLESDRGTGDFAREPFEGD